jgi:hypothetical protein
VRNVTGRTASKTERAVNIELDCPTCKGRLTLAARGVRGGGRPVGSCGTCGAAFTLTGGRIAPAGNAVVHRPATPARTFGAFGSALRRSAEVLAAGDRTARRTRPGWLLPPLAAQAQTTTTTEENP